MENQKKFFVLFVNTRVSQKISKAFLFVKNTEIKSFQNLHVPVAIGLNLELENLDLTFIALNVETYHSIKV